MDSFIDLIFGSGLALFSTGYGYWVSKEKEPSNKFIRYSIITGISLTAVGSSLVSIKAGRRFMKAG